VAGARLTPAPQYLPVKIKEFILSDIPFNQAHIQVVLKQFDTDASSMVFDLKRVPPFTRPTNVDVIWLLLEVDDFHFRI
jgi:hypothetical protein